jgi:hypothetical protein
MAAPRTRWRFFEFADGLITRVVDFSPSCTNRRRAASTWSHAG